MNMISLFSNDTKQPQATQHQTIYYYIHNAQLIIDSNDVANFGIFVQEQLKLKALWPRQLPTINKQQLNFLQLCISVFLQGGVGSLQSWKDVSKLMGLDSLTNASFLLKNKYFQLIHPIIESVELNYVFVEQQSSILLYQQQNTKMRVQNYAQNTNQCGIRCNLKLNPIVKSPSVNQSTLRSLVLEFVRITDPLFNMIFQLHPSLESVNLCWLGEVTTVPQKVVNRLMSAQLFGLPAVMKDYVRGKIMLQQGTYEFVSRESHPYQVWNEEKQLYVHLPNAGCVDCECSNTGSPLDYQLQYSISLNPLSEDEELWV